MAAQRNEAGDSITPAQANWPLSQRGDDETQTTVFSPQTTLVGHPTPLTYTRQPGPHRYPYATIDYFNRWFPRVDPDHKQAQNLSVRLARRESILLTAAAATTVIFCGNLTALLFFYFKPSYHKLFRSGTTVIHTGQCTRVKQINSVLHLLVNVLGSVLYLFSQLCMQLITAPTRQELDKAHQRNDWYDIGILSFRNYFRSSWLKKSICFLLFVSSWPLHFIYNSVISDTNVAEFAYPAVVVSESFFYGATWGDAFITNVPDRSSDLYSTTIVPGVLGKFDNITVSRMANYTQAPNLWTNLTNELCLTRYSDGFGLHSNLMIVVEQYPQENTSSLVEYHYTTSGIGTASGHWDQRYWICSNGTSDGPDCDKRFDFAATANKWVKHGHTVSYCLSWNLENAQGWNDCQIKFSPVLMLAVCICIFIKCACMWYCYGSKTLRTGTTICTLGDAIASFLEKQDPFTKNLNNVTRQEIVAHEGNWGFKPQEWISSEKQIQPWQKTVTSRRLYVTLAFWIITIVFLIIQVILQSVWTHDEGSYETFSAILGMGWGRVDASSIYNLRSLHPTAVSTFIANVLFANYWQLIVSLLSLYTVSLLACYHVSQEWSSFYTKRKFLRVTHPQGMQRSKYSVSMPLRYGLPFTIAFIVLHWFVSQSNFVVQSIAYGGSDGTVHSWNPNPTQAGYVTVGYSPAGTFTCLIWTIVLFIAVLGLTYLHETQSGMPLAATCSAAISAACHPPAGDNQAHLFPVQWGLVDQRAYADQHQAGKVVPAVDKDQWVFTTLYPLKQSNDVEVFHKPWFVRHHDKNVQPLAATSKSPVEKRSSFRSSPSREQEQPLDGLGIDTDGQGSSIADEEEKSPPQGRTSSSHEQRQPEVGVDRTTNNVLTTEPATYYNQVVRRHPDAGIMSYHRQA